MRHVKRWMIGGLACALLAAAGFAAQATANGRPSSPPGFTWPAVGTALPDGKVAGSVHFTTPVGSAATVAPGSASLASLLASEASDRGVTAGSFGVRYALYTDAAKPEMTNVPVYIISHDAGCAFYISVPAGVKQPTDCVPSTTYDVVDAATGLGIISMTASAPPGYYDEGGIVLQVPQG